MYVRRRSDRAARIRIEAADVITRITQVLANEVNMTIVKDALDFLMRHVLRIGLPKNRRRKFSRSADAADRPAIKTLRTFPPGGDPVDDMIEFVLKDGGSAPSGFRDP
jgi:hypothetical protein